MKRAFVFSIALTLGLSGSGCLFGGKNSEPAPQQQPNNNVEEQETPSWKLTFLSSCGDADEAEECVGRYGFSLSENRQFQVGPGPAGQLKTGTLEALEFQKIEQLLSQALSSGEIPEGGQENCRDAEEVESTFRGDKVTLTRRATETTILREDPERLCFQTSTVEAAMRLHSAIRDLAEKYYSLPFPDSCAETVAALHALYAPLQECNTNEDCAYFSPDYDPVNASVSEFVLTDRCQLVRPLIAGNTTAVSRSLRALREAVNAAESVCGHRIVREDCMSVRGFDASVGAPVCQDRVCRPNPSAGSFY